MKKTLGLVLGCILLVSPIMVSAQSYTDEQRATLIATLQQLVVILTQQIEILIQQKQVTTPTVLPIGGVSDVQPPVQIPVITPVVTPVIPQPFDSVATGSDYGVTVKPGQLNTDLGNIKFSAADEGLRIGEMGFTSSAPYLQLAYCDDSGCGAFSSLTSEFHTPLGSGLWVPGTKPLTISLQEAPTTPGNYTVTVVGTNHALGMTSGNYRNIQGLPFTLHFTVTGNQGASQDCISQQETQFRNEVSAAGGMTTESQVLATALQRCGQ